MKPVRCDNCKFFYDAEKYGQCPHCQTGMKNPSADAVIQPSVNTSINVKPDKERKFTRSRKIKNTEIPENKDIYSDSSMEKKVAEKKADIVPEKVDTPAKKDLRSAIDQASSVQKTVAFYNLPNESEPVVGWLVCIKGEYIGESFNLKAGRNNIGRALTMDVALAKEKTVSRERHASIFYEPKKMQFFLQPGENNSLTYLNDDLAMTAEKLKAYDKLIFGESEFVFMPLCGENFSWDKYIK